MVVKVLEKVFAILEFVASRQGRPVLPAEIVHALNLNQTTCIRLLKDLVDNGYLSQISRTCGYVTGPTAVWIGKNSLFQSHLYSVADPILRDASVRDNISMLVAVRHGKYRVLISGYNSPAGVQLNMTLPRFPDLFCAATGIMLLAYTPEAELTRRIQDNPSFELPPWHVGITRGEIDLILYSIRQKKIFRNHSLGVEAGAVPLFADGKMLAALGGAWRYALPAAERDMLAEKLQRVAEEISALLSDVSRHL